MPPSSRPPTGKPSYALPLQAPPPETLAISTRRRTRIAHGTGSHQADVLQADVLQADLLDPTADKLPLPIQFIPVAYSQGLGSDQLVSPSSRPPSPIRYHRPAESQWQPLLLGLGILSVASLLFWLVAFSFL